MISIIENTLSPDEISIRIKIKNLILKSEYLKKRRLEKLNRLQRRNDDDIQQHKRNILSRDKNFFTPSLIRTHWNSRQSVS